MNNRKLNSLATLSCWMVQSLLLMALMMPPLTCSAASYIAPVTVVTEILPPYQQRDPQGKLDGYSVEVMMALFKLLDEKPKILVLPWARAYEMALNDANILIFSLSYSPERADLFHWLGVLAHEESYFWGLKSNYPQPVTSIELLRDARISVTHHSNPDRYLTNNGFTNVFQVVQPEQNIGLLFKQRTDLVVGTELPLRALVTAMGHDMAKLVKVYRVEALESELKLAFSLNTDPAIVAKYRAGFKQLSTSDQFQAIKKKWLEGMSSNGQ